ncbi:MAG: PHP domain-containing protein [Clostridia bacterium]|nr:PHP domain-containing protein [Clostridia bacterium]
MSGPCGHIARLDDRDPDVRLDAARRLAALAREGKHVFPAPARDVNNHIHTTYSFSPYTPARAVWEARRAGLATAGIMDHDTAAGIREFREAGRLLGLPVTAGAELRVTFAGTPLAGRRINHPDQESTAYVALHGVPEPSTDALDRFLAPVRAARETRNRAMAVRLDALAREAGTGLDYDRDVLPLSEAVRGGTVTERHLLYAFAVRLTSILPDRAELVRALGRIWGIRPSDRIAAALTDPGNPAWLYDLTGLFKSELLPRVYLPAAEELLPVREVLSFARSRGIIAAYPYLGDVTESVTGDKKAQRFEDGYLDELFDVLADLGFQAVTYMPSRNTPAQLTRLRGLCRERNFFEISGEDINQPRQPFVCEAMRRAEFSGLHDAAWALIGHEMRAARDPDDGMFSDAVVRRCPRLKERIAGYSEYARTRFIE